MGAFELCELPSMENDWTASRSSLCWHCKKDVNTRNLVSPCNCATDIHVYCLEEIANKYDILYCLCCIAPYPLEVRPKSLLKMLGNVCKYFFAILFALILEISITVLILYLVLLQILDLLKIPFLFIIQIIIICVFLCFIIYTIVHHILNWSDRIYEHYYQWYKSTYERRLIRPSTNKNIEEYNIQE